MRYPWLCLQFLLGCAGCASTRQHPLPPPTLAAAPSSMGQHPRRFDSGWPADGSGARVTVDPSDGLSSDEAAVLAVFLNPDLIAARDELGQARAQIVAAGILPNPVLGIEYDHPYGNGSAGTNDVVNLTLSWDLKPLLARSAKRSAAEQGLQQVDLGILWQEWQVAQQARMLVVRLAWLRKRVLLAEREREYEAQTAQMLEAASQAGDATLEQVGVQRASLAATQNTLFELQQLALDAESELLKLLGNPRERGLEVPEPSPEKEVALPSVSSCLSQRLDLQALREGYRAQEASLRAAVLDQFPDFSIGIAHQHNESSLDFVGAFVSVGLPVLDRNQGQVQLAEATRQRLMHEYDARAASVRADLQRLSRYSEVVKQRLPVVTGAIASLESIELEEREAVKRGDLDRLSYQAVRSALLDQRLQQAALSQALAESAVAVKTVCGTKPMAERAGR